MKSFPRYAKRIQPAVYDTNINTLQIQHGCSSARSEMTRRIKDNMIRYLGAGQNPVQVEHHVSVYKAFRGLHDPNIGRLLIPAEDLDQWDEDPNGYVHLSYIRPASKRDPAQEPTSRLECSSSQVVKCPFFYTKTTHITQKIPRRVFSGGLSSYV